MGFPIVFFTTKQVHYSSVTGPASNEMFAQKLAINDYANNLFGQISLYDVAEKIKSAETEEGNEGLDITKDGVIVSVGASTDNSVVHEVQYKNNCMYSIRANAVGAKCFTKTSQNWKGERKFKMDAEVQIEVTILRTHRREVKAASGSAASSNYEGLFTTVLRGNSENEVGQLEDPSINDPNKAYPVELNKPYIFICHRGPDTKELIVRPTDWFLSNILNVESFFDARTMPVGGDQMLSMLEPAYRCNHALVLFSPRFRESKYCVKELNTFMARHNKGNLKIIPAFWNIKDIKGYAPALKKISRHKNVSPNPAEYMVAELWPLLIQILKGSNNSQPRFRREDLVKHLIDYVRQAPDGRDIPVELTDYVEQNQ